MFSSMDRHVPVLADLQELSADLQEVNADTGCSLEDLRER